MRRFVKIFLQAGLLAALFVSCSERRYAELPGAESQKALDRWIEERRELLEKEAPVESITVVNELNPEGATMYYQWLGHANDNTKAIEASDWLRIDYIAYTTNGYEITPDGKHRRNVYSNRREDVARMLGTFNPYTRYNTLYTVYSTDRSWLYEGQYEILGKMKLGDSIRIFLPPALATKGTTIITQHGYGGSTTWSHTSPIIMEMKITEVVTSPMTTETENVKEFASSVLGVPQADTTVYAAYSYYKDDEDVEPIPEDGNIHVYYVGSFLENNERGFVFDTNIDSVGTRLKRNTDGLYPLLWPSTTSLIASFKKVLEAGGYEYGSKITFVTSSTWAYGGDYGGQAGSDTQTYIEPFASLIFDLYIYNPEWDEEEEDQ